MSVKVTPSKIADSDLLLKELKHIKINFYCKILSQAGIAIFTGMDIKGQQ
jgi:hypothetical protein